MSINDGGLVTVSDLFKVMSDIRTDLSKALTKLEVIDSRNQAADQTQNDHELRIRSLEAFKWKLIGAILIMSTIIGVLAGYIGAGLRHGG